MTDPVAPLDDLASLLDPAAAARLEAASPGMLAAARGFWRAALDGGLSPRMRELVLLALFASAATLNDAAVARHVRRARAAGASDGDVVDVLLAITGLANHALYSAIPLLMETLRETGHPEADMPDLTPEMEAIRQDFVATRGFWNADRDALGRLMPDYFQALSALSTAPWKHGALTPKERELIYIAIDCSVSHSYVPGLKLHIRNALAQGASRAEILAVFRLAALMGMQGFLTGAEALAREEA